jgi:hypothetical protein
MSHANNPGRDSPPPPPTKTTPPPKFPPSFFLLLFVSLAFISLSEKGIFLSQEKNHNRQFIQLLFRFPTTSQGNKRSSKNEKRQREIVTSSSYHRFNVNTTMTHIYSIKIISSCIYLPLGLLFLRSVLLLFNRKT